MGTESQTFGVKLGMLDEGNQFTPNIPPMKSDRRHCPSCGSDELLRSRRRGLDRLLSFANIYPYRCRNYSCERRFYGMGNDSDLNYTDSGILKSSDLPNVAAEHQVQTEH